MFFFFEYLHEDGRKRLKHVVGLPRVCMLLNLIVMQLLECKLTMFFKKGTTHKVSVFTGEASGTVLRMTYALRGRISPAILVILEN